MCCSHLFCVMILNLHYQLGWMGVNKTIYSIFSCRNFYKFHLSSKRALIFESILLLGPWVVLMMLPLTWLIHTCVFTTSLCCLSSVFTGVAFLNESFTLCKQKGIHSLMRDAHYACEKYFHKGNRKLTNKNNSNRSKHSAHHSTINLVR